MEVSFLDVMSLYRKKLGAEKTGDMKLLKKMKEVYPDLFTNDFAEFISSLKDVSTYLNTKYETNYSTLFKPELLN